MKRIFTSAPLPFQGQKRRFVPEFHKALRHFEKGTTFVDLFGGSGLLSHIVKRTRPDATVIYNDFDGFRERLALIPKTNKMLADLRVILADTPRGARVNAATSEAVLHRVHQDEMDGGVDYITLSGSLLFSGKYATCYERFAREGLYNNIRMADYSAEGYLDGIDIVRYDYKELFEQYKDEEAVVFIADPPYLSTDCSSYSSYWRLADYLDVLKVLEGASYFYFTSSKSSVIELCEWLAQNGGFNPFGGAKRVEVAGSVNYHSSYRDIMMYLPRL